MYSLPGIVIGLGKHTTFGNAETQLSKAAEAGWIGTLIALEAVTTW